LADEDGYCTSEILPLEFERNILPQYARYYLMSPAFLRYANKCSYGVKMPRLGTADGKKAIISVPPFEEQRRIVIAIEQALTVFRDEDWLAMVDYVTVTEDAGITVTFKDGTEIES